ncbi:malectin domain-containing carbohydrate-binding protein [Telmatobacter bradus]|uniref:malectin domain-containing carbohydrate-binding protein n=1 Tax=Telmatobacter bradus TaxID=474953 RepID=UPI003B428432
MMETGAARTPVEAEAEKTEFENVLEALVRSPRLEKLLRHVGEKYFAHQLDDLNEYNIATEVFDRSKSTFNAGEDAIARVEAHRLRKRLKEYYEGPGKDHLLQISLPSGSYAPLFTRRSAASAPVAVSSAPLERMPAALPEAEFERPATAPLLKNWWLRFAALAVAAGLVLVALFAILHPRHTDTPADASLAAQSSSTPAAATAAPLRILAGYSGAPQIDSSGSTWLADRYFSGGETRGGAAGNFVARTSDQLLFQNSRGGDFSYAIPLPPGVYELHLYFVTSEPSSEDYATFGVYLNGNPLLQGFDVNTDAQGNNIADERIFRAVSPSKDGLLHLTFAAERGAPSLSALEILPGIAHATLPARLITQQTPFTDHSGQLWRPDNYYMNGRMAMQHHPTTGTADPDLFAGERYGHFSYAIPADPRDRYTLVLHFAEFYFGPAGRGGVGSRQFRVLCNGNTLVDNLDIFKEAGSLHVLTKSFNHLRPTAQGKLNLTFEPVLNNATVSGIEVLDEGR